MRKAKVLVVQSMTGSMRKFLRLPILTSTSSIQESSVQNDEKDAGDGYNAEESKFECSTSDVEEEEADEETIENSGDILYSASQSKNEFEKVKIDRSHEKGNQETEEIKENERGDNPENNCNVEENKLETSILDKEKGADEEKNPNYSYNVEENKLESSTSTVEEEAEGKINPGDVYNVEENKFECSTSDVEEEEEDEETIESSGDVLYSDISEWPFPVPENLRVDLIKRGSEPFQNKDGPFAAVTRKGDKDKTKGTNRQLTSDWFYISQPNGDKILRTWMTYSIKNQSLYCFCCRLFSTDKSSNITSKFVTGFQAWWKLSPKVNNHETSEQHEASFEKWKTLRTNLLHNKTIDQVSLAASETERKKWRDLLKRVLDVILFLAKQNLPFRGHREHMLAENRGNFLQLIKLLSKYDAVLREHLIKLEQSTQSQSSKRLTSYLSPTIQNEFISLLGGIVKDKILTEIKNAKYFCIIFDSTPDISHVDQMSEIIRYVHIENKKVEVKESFIGYFQQTGKKAVDITKDILQAIEQDGLDIKMCRGQGYDNASTMAGVHSGVQARICEINPKAIFVPCTNHSLNLCGVHSFATVPICVTFFGTLESLYVFFSASTHRWQILMQNVGVAVKRLSETRWNAHYEAVKPVFKCFKKIVDAIEELCDVSETIETRGAAQTLLPAMCDFSFLCFLYLWSNVLEEINHVQKYLQIRSISLERCVIKMKSLKSFLKDKRNDLVEESLQFAKNTCEEMEIPVVKRRNIRRKKIMPGEKATDEPLTLEQELKRSMLECIDRFQEEIDKRTKAMERISEQFAVLEPNNLIKTPETELSKFVQCLVKNYDEISSDGMLKEIPRLRRFLQAAKISNDESVSWTALKFLEFVIEYELSESFPNLTLALRFFLTLCVSVASCERSFSKLKLIKNYLRSTMSQSRLSSLALLSIENNAAESIDFDEAISKFADEKVRRKRL